MSLLAETAPAHAGSTPAIAWEYVWFAGQPIAQIETATGEIAWYFNDHLGTPVLQTDANANTVWHAEYEPYGEVLAMRIGEDRHQPLRFPGQESDGLSDIRYNIHRWYRAGWGRYTQSDPIFDLFGKFPDPDLYAYVHNNPLRWADPLGLAAVSTIQCDGDGNYEVVNKNTKCDSECTEKHERSHIADWQDRYGADSCKNRPKGYLPLGGAGYKEFLKESECKAYKIGFGCRLALSESGCCPAAKSGMKRDEDQMQAWGCD